MKLLLWSDVVFTLLRFNRISRDLTGGLFDRNRRKIGEREREQGVPVSNLTRLGGKEIATTTLASLESIFDSV